MHTAHGARQLYYILQEHQKPICSLLLENKWFMWLNTNTARSMLNTNTVSTEIMKVSNHMLMLRLYKTTLLGKSAYSLNKLVLWNSPSCVLLCQFVSFSLWLCLPRVSSVFLLFFFSLTCLIVVSLFCHLLFYCLHLAFGTPAVQIKRVFCLHVGPQLLAKP